jgi:hypothetical protein
MMAARLTAGARYALPVLAVVTLAAGCGRGGAPSNGQVWVVNASRAEASLHWQSPGVLAGSGTDPVPACGQTGRGFAGGVHQLKITTPVDVFSMTLDAPESGHVEVWLRIDGAGVVERLEDPPEETSPPC